MAQQQTATRKVYYKPGTHSTTNPIPMLRITGKKLAQYGFSVGSSIVVTMKLNQITISKVPA